jgi:1-acyl-sn-glycerol-3-phosphate acyltransferase
VIVASNHLSFADSMVIPFVVPRKVVFLAKKDYFTGTGLKGALVRGWFEGIGMVPVDRDDTKAAMASLDIALDVLARGRRSGSTPRAPGRATAGSTAGAPGWPTSR